jgi:hypothetical protein
MNSFQHNQEMNNRYVYGSLTRNSDLPSTQSSWVVHPIKRDEWDTGDYVCGKFTKPTGSACEYVQLTTGRRAKLMRGDLVVGVLGVRKATLEAVGDWHAIGNDGRMEDLVGAGLFGKETDHSSRIPPHPSFVYQGHVIRNGAKVCMQDFVPTCLPVTTSYTCPTILILGTSMSVGKTWAAQVIIHLLKEMGVKNVVGTKLTGVGFYSDILSMRDGGADAVLDFVDAGLPSTTVPLEQYKQSLQLLLSMISEEHPDIVVAEAGASPFEAYNGAAVLEEMLARAQFVVLCASDAYSVLGIMQTFGLQPDIITGIATATSAGMELVEKLTGVPALNLCKDESVEKLEKLLRVALHDEIPLT